MHANPAATYDNWRNRWTFLYDSYFGGTPYRNPTLTTLSNQTAWHYGLNSEGQRVRSPNRFVTYLVPHPTEDEDAFQTRLALASYINIVAPIVDAYAEAVTTNVSRTIPDSIDISDVDGRGSAWGEHVEEVARWDAAYGCLATVVDTPKIDDAAKPASRLVEESAGLKPRAIIVPPTGWAWVDVDENGCVTEFAYVDDAYIPTVMPIVNASTQTIRVRVWTLKGTPLPASTEIGDTSDVGTRATLGVDVGAARWEIRQGTIQTQMSTGISAQRAAFGTLIAAGDLPAELNGELPVVFSFFKRVSNSRWPLGQSLIDDAADIARKVYNKLSWEDEIHRKAGFPFLALPAASSGGQLDPQTRLEIGPDKAVPYDANTGAPAWVQPSSESSKELRESCMFMVALALRTCGLEVAADQSAQVQSGEALRIRSRDFESRAKRFAANMQRYETAVLRLMALLCHVDPDTISVSYPKRFTLPDQSEDLKNALLLLSPSQMPVEIGTEAKLRIVMQAINAVLSLSDEEAKAMMDEIRGIMEEDEADIAAQREASAAQRDAMVAQFKSKGGKAANDGATDPDASSEPDPNDPAEGDENEPPPPKKAA